MDRIGKYLLPALLVVAFVISSCSKKVDPTIALKKYLLEESTLSQTAWEYYTVQQTSKTLIAYIIFPKRKPGISRRAPIEHEVRSLCPDKTLHSFWDDTGIKSFDFILMKNVDRTKGKAKRLVQITCNADFSLAAHERGEPQVRKAKTKPATATFNNAEQWYEMISTAIRTDDVDTTAELASAGKQYMNTRDDKGISVLHLSISASVAQILIDNGAMIDAKSTLGRTPLIYATEYAKTDLAALLIKHGADVNHTDKQEVTPLKRASSKEMAELLVANGVNVPKDALFIPAGDGKLELVKYLYSLGAKIDAINGFGRTPLHDAALRSSNSNEKGQIETAKWLLENGAEVNKRDKFGHTPYDLVSWGGQTPNPFMLRLLKSHGGMPGKTKK